MVRILSLILASALVIITGGCSPVNQPGTTLSQDYYPLKVGNRWEYVYSNTLSGTNTVVVLSEKTVGTEKHFVVVSFGESYADTTTLFKRGNIVGEVASGNDRRW